MILSSDWSILLQVEPFVIGVCGGSASGKTTVANKIISELDVPWVTLLSMDSFYKVLNERQHEAAAVNEVIQCKIIALCLH